MRWPWQEPIQPVQPESKRDLEIKLQVTKTKLEEAKRKKDEIVGIAVSEGIDSFLDYASLKRDLQAEVAQGGFDPSLLEKTPRDTKLEKFLVKTHYQEFYRKLKETPDSGVNKIDADIKGYEIEVGRIEKLLGGPKPEKLPDLRLNKMGRVSAEREYNQKLFNESIAELTANYWQAHAADVKDEFNTLLDSKSVELRRREPDYLQRKEFLLSLLILAKVKEQRSANERTLNSELDKSVDTEISLRKEFADTKEKKKKTVKQVADHFFYLKGETLNLKDKEWHDIKNEFETKLEEIQDKIEKKIGPDYTAGRLDEVARKERALMASEISNAKKRGVNAYFLEKIQAPEFDVSDNNQKKDFLTKVWAREQAWKEIKSVNKDWAFVECVKIYEDEKEFLLEALGISDKVNDVNKRLMADVDKEFKKFTDDEKDAIYEEKDFTDTSDQKKVKAFWKSYKEELRSKRLADDPEYRKLRHFENYLSLKFPESGTVLTSIKKMDPDMAELKIEVVSAEWAWDSVRMDPKFWEAVIQLDDFINEMRISEKKFKTLRTLDPVEAEKIERMNEFEFSRDAMKVENEIKGLEVELQKTDTNDPESLVLKSKIERKKLKAADFYIASGPYLPDILTRIQQGDIHFADAGQDRQIDFHLADLPKVQTVAQNSELGIERCEREIDNIIKYILQELVLPRATELFNASPDLLRRQAARLRPPLDLNDPAQRVRFFKDMVINEFKTTNHAPYLEKQQLTEFYRKYIADRKEALANVSQKLAEKKLKMPESLSQQALKEIAASSVWDPDLIAALEQPPADLTDLTRRLREFKDILQSTGARLTLDPAKQLKINDLRTEQSLTHLGVLANSRLMRLVNQYLDPEQFFSYHERVVTGTPTPAAVLETKRREVIPQLKEAIEGLPR